MLARQGLSNNLQTSHIPPHKIWELAEEMRRMGLPCTGENL